MPNYILCCFLWLIVLLNRFRFGDFLYPGFLQSLIWAIIVSLFSILQDDFIPISYTTWVVIGLGVVFFSMGAFTSTYGHSPFVSQNDARILPARFPTLFLIMLTAAFVPLLVQKAYMFFMNGPFENGFANLRYAVTANRQETGGYGFFKYLTPIAFFATGQQILRVLHLSSKREKSLTFISIVSAMIYGLISTGRTTIILYLLIVIGIPLVLRRISYKHAVYILLILGIFLFISIGILMGKFGTFTDNLSYNFSLMYKTVETYLLAGIPALNLQLQTHPDCGVSHILRTIYAILHPMGFSVKSLPLIQNFVFTPFPTNVYTVYQPYFLDLGLLALPIFQFGFGFIHGFLYRKATVYRPASSYVFLFAISMFPLALQFFEDLYFSLMSLWVQFLILTILFHFLADNHVRRIAYA